MSEKEWEMNFDKYWIEYDMLNGLSETSRRHSRQAYFAARHKAHAEMMERNKKALKILDRMEECIPASHWRFKIIRKALTMEG